MAQDRPIRSSLANLQKRVVSIFFLKKLQGLLRPNSNFESRDTRGDAKVSVFLVAFFCIGEVRLRERFQVLEGLKIG